jgi:hypothetical protein
MEPNAKPGITSPGKAPFRLGVNFQVLLGEYIFSLVGEIYSPFP